MKKMISLVILVCLCLSLCACGVKNTPEEDVPIPSLVPEATTEPIQTPSLPTATSEELKLYSYSLSNGRKYVVNEYGEYDDRYIFDELGNITDMDGIPVIMASNVRIYRPIRTMYFGQESYQLMAEGDTTNSASELSSTQVYSNCVVELYCAPASATNGIVCVRSDSDAVIELRPNGNARFATVESKDLESGEVVMRVEDLSRPIQIYVRVLTNLAGKATIMARSLDRTADAECTVTVELSDARKAQPAGTGNRIGTLTPTVSPAPTPSPAISPAPGATEFVNASGDPTNHVHSYKKTVTAPTATEMGYTTYTCTGCGYCFRDDYVSKLVPDEPTAPAHTHSYVATQVSPTETEPGYTLFVCEACGDSYKANITPAYGTDASEPADAPER